jgi:DNA-binding NarL/FixJ family response regulator
VERSTIRILVVDDYEPWRRFVRLALLLHKKLEIIGEAADGMEAVTRAQELQPDLILLDIGLPNLNGIEAARQICVRAPQSKILFVSDNRAGDLVEAALQAGGVGYLVKSDAGTELLAAVESVLQGKPFVSASVSGPARHTSSDPVADNRPRSHRHEAGFYSDDQRLLDDLTQFVGSALKAGSSVIVVATESHRESLRPRLEALGIDVGMAIGEGRYVTADAADTLSAVMFNGQLDGVRLAALLGDLIAAAARAAKGQARVAVFGECVHLLWAQGQSEAVMQMERVGNELIKKYDADILCGYSLGNQRAMDGHIFRQICEAHSAVHSR